MLIGNSLMTVIIGEVICFPFPKAARRSSAHPRSTRPSPFQKGPPCHSLWGPWGQRGDGEITAVQTLVLHLVGKQQERLCVRLVPSTLARPHPLSTPLGTVRELERDLAALDSELVGE